MPEDFLSQTVVAARQEDAGNDAGASTKGTTVTVTSAPTAGSAFGSTTRATSSSTNFDIAVIGGGIAGLVAALKAAESGATVAVLDSHLIGGRGRTAEREGYRFNVGAHALYLAGHLQPFLAARNLAPTGGVPGPTVRFLRDEMLWPITLGPVGLLRTNLLRPSSRVRLLGLLARLPRLKTEGLVGMPWQEFLGNEPDDVAGIVAALSRLGTYVNAPTLLDTAAALGQLKLGLKGVRYVDGGWQTIVDGLARAGRIAGVQVMPGRAVSTVSSNGGVIVETAQGAVTARAAIVAGLSPAAAARITGSAFCGAIDVGPAVHASGLDLALNRVHDGAVFGIDQPLYLSAHAPLAKLAPTGRGLVSVMRYTPVQIGPADDDGGDVDRDVGGDATDRAKLSRFAEMAGISSTDIVHERYLRRMVVAHGLPMAASGGLRGRPGVGALGVRGVFLAGDWVGPAGELADASSASGEAAAVAAVAFVRRAGVTRG